MKNYFDKLDKKVSRYKNKYAKSPRKAAAKLAFWNAKCIFKKHSVSNILKDDKSSEKITSIMENERLEEDVLKIAIAEGGGIGDALFQLIYLKELRKNINCSLALDFFSRACEAFFNIPFIDNVFLYNPNNINKKNYDIFITSRRLWNIEINNEKKVNKLAPEFYSFCTTYQSLVKDIFENDFNDNKISQYSLLLNKNRFEQANVFGLLPIDKNTSKYMNWKLSAFDVLHKFNIIPNTYITICRACDSKYSSNHPKLWPLKYYEKLVEQLKNKYPQIPIIQIGSNEIFGTIKNVDLCLVGKTSLDEVKILLKYSILHIDGEGGLVHMNKCLNGKSLVMFGPTSPQIYGYDENINMYYPYCPISCCQVVPSWKDGCIKGFKDAPCMKQLTPEKVFENIHNFLSDKIKFSHTEKSVSDQDVLLLFKKSKNIAIFSRPTYSKLRQLRKTNEFIIYDENLSLPSKSKNINCRYLEKLRKLGLNAEYATPFNIPVKDGTYDLFIMNTNIEKEYVKYVVLEGLRVIKYGGNFIMKKSMSEGLDNISFSDISEKKEFICIKKDIKND